MSEALGGKMESRALESVCDEEASKWLRATTLEEK